MIAVVGHKSILNFSSSDKFANCGLSSSNFLNKQFRSAVNMVHSTKKWNSESGGGMGADDAGRPVGQHGGTGPKKGAVQVNVVRVLPFQTRPGTWRNKALTFKKVIYMFW